MSDARIALLTRLYERFNARHIEAILPDLHPDVDWLNGWEGGRVRGRAAVRDYWTRQWRAIDSSVTPLAMETTEDGRVFVTAHQIVRPLDGAAPSDSVVRHVYTFDGETIARMEIVEA